ncbi:unnamed protein product [Bemisia tabaci]|uniref:AAA+ ATPase domain-containing protein n=1 Tax=Bemisia tabaci TaxID=7038 RepID=A0A9P0F8G0_BEMTA|nr:unnamed protein product [Bemisia tabaci]
MTAKSGINRVALFLTVIMINQNYGVTRATVAEENQTHHSKEIHPSAVSNPESSNKIRFSTERHPQDLVPPSTDFSEVRNSKAFVDKTFFLYEWLTHRPKHWYVTAPPGFGKTTLAKMAVQFLNASFEIVNGTAKFHDKHKTATYELFKGTNIFEIKEFFDEHFQNYAVVYVDLAPLSSTTQAVFRRDDDFTVQDFHGNFKTVIKGMMNFYPSLLHHKEMADSERRSFKGYLMDGKDTPMTPGKFWQSAYFLMQLLKKCLKLNVIVIVDSYDALCKPAMFGDVDLVQRPYLASYFINFSKMFNKDGITTVLYLGSFKTVELMLQKPSEVLRPRQTSRIIKHTAFSSEERVAKFFGLSSQEVSDVLGKYSMQDHFKLVNDLLNGHAVLESPLTLFNTRSVLLYIANRNATLKAITSPLTNEILWTFKKMFANLFVGNVIIESIYKNKTEVLMRPNEVFSFTSFTQLQLIADNREGDAGVKESFKLDNAFSFIRILQFLGLISAISETRLPGRHSVNLRVSSHIDAELMNEYFYDGGYTQKFFRYNNVYKMAMIRAIEGLAPTDGSIQSLGRAIHDIFKVKVPEAEYQLKSLMYVFSREVAAAHSPNFIIEGRITAPTIEHSKLNESGESRIIEKIDIVLIMKNKGIGIIITSKLNTNALSVLKDMHDRSFVEVFNSDLRFSNLKIENKMLVGVSVSQDKSVEIAADVWHKNIKSSLKRVEVHPGRQIP